MKSLIIATAGILAAFVPASAGVLLPNLYAVEYCSMRSNGVGVTDSIRWATQQSYDASGVAIKVTREDGTQMDADVLAANAAAEKRCPQY